MHLRLLLVMAMVAAAPATCGASEGPGQANYRGTLTVLTRTEAVVIFTSQSMTLNVPACGEQIAEGALMNGWNLTSPGRDAFRAVGGHSEAHSYLIVTNIVTQLNARPEQLPECAGLLQPAG